MQQPISRTVCHYLLLSSRPNDLPIKAKTKRHFFLSFKLGWALFCDGRRERESPPDAFYGFRFQSSLQKSRKVYDDDKAIAVEKRKKEKKEHCLHSTHSCSNLFPPLLREEDLSLPPPLASPLALNPRSPPPPPLPPHCTVGALQQNWEIRDEFPPFNRVACCGSKM